MEDEHKHLWGPSGCWCGAQRCNQAPTMEELLQAARMREKTPKPCSEAATAGSEYCAGHAVLADVKKAIAK